MRFFTICKEKKRRKKRRENNDNVVIRHILKTFHAILLHERVHMEANMFFFSIIDVGLLQRTISRNTRVVNIFVHCVSFVVRFFFFFLSRVIECMYLFYDL